MEDVYEVYSIKISYVYLSAGYQVTYVGFVLTGSTGDVKEIDRAIKMMIKSHSYKVDFGPKLEKVKKTVSFEIGEIGVKVVGVENGNVSVL